MAKGTEPLTESYFYILLCLYDGSNHGYGIMQKTELLSGGRLKIGSGTMYGAISNMIKKGWIYECESREVEQDRRRLYELTQEGRAALVDEYRRLLELAGNAKNIMEGKSL